MTSRNGYDISGLLIGTSYVALAMIWLEPLAPVVLLTADGVTFGAPVTTYGKWVETRITFTATSPTQRLGLVRQAGEIRIGRTYIGAVLCTPAPYTGGYFDGSFAGPDYMWGTTEGESPSFFYPDQANRSYIISQLLLENCPIGVVPAVPVFGAIPTQ